MKPSTKPLLTEVKLTGPNRYQPKYEQDRWLCAVQVKEPDGKNNYVLNYRTQKSFATGFFVGKVPPGYGLRFGLLEQWQLLGVHLLTDHLFVAGKSPTLVLSGCGRQMVNIVDGTYMFYARLEAMPEMQVTWTGVD